MLHVYLKLTLLFIILCTKFKNIYSCHASQFLLLATHFEWRFGVVLQVTILQKKL